MAYNFILGFSTQRLDTRHSSTSDFDFTWLGFLLQVFFSGLPVEYLNKSFYIFEQFLEPVHTFWGQNLLKLCIKSCQMQRQFFFLQLLSRRNFYANSTIISDRTVFTLSDSAAFHPKLGLWHYAIIKIENWNGFDSVIY